MAKLHHRHHEIMTVNNPTARHIIDNGGNAFIFTPSYLESRNNPINRNTEYRLTSYIIDMSERVSILWFLGCCHIVFDFFCRNTIYEVLLFPSQWRGGGGIWKISSPWFSVKKIFLFFFSSSVFFCFLINCHNHWVIRTYCTTFLCLLIAIITE